MIGILAGMGPKSTAPFVDKVVEQCQILYGAKHDIDFPPLMIYSCPTPFFVDRPINHNKLENAIIDGAKKLASTGVDFIVMPCNTAHSYFDQIEAAVSVPVLNIVVETLKRIPVLCKKVAVVGTAATMDTGIYQTALANSGLQFINNEGWQETVNKLITLVKSSTDNSNCMDLWHKLAKEIGQQADAVIMACTDLNVITDKSNASLEIIDTSLSLAMAAVEKYYSSLSHIH